jgi:ATP-binding cassette subfamily B protein
LVFQHLHLVGVTGSLLLLVYWSIKLPSLGKRLATLALQYPAQRNIVIRLLEPLKAPNETIGTSEKDPAGSSEAQTGQRSTSHNDLPAAGVEISLQGVTVVAAGHKILQDISLTIQSGEHVAIVGPSGAGKSSLIGLLLGWYRADEGAILIDQQLFSPIHLEKLRRETAWVDPSIQIWNRSLLDNVQYSGKAGSYSALGSLFERMDLANVIARLPDGLQSPLGEGGSHLSGGEGQRIRFARAMWQEGVRLVLLDEPFRGLDREQRHHHLAKARQLWEGATVMCVTHDVAETRSFDRVLVIENGCLVEDGRPEQLAAESTSRYRALLDAEVSVRQELWEGPLWRRLRLEHGQVEETVTGGLSPMRHVGTNAVRSGMVDHA